MKKLSLLLLTLTVCFFTACHKDIWAELENLDQRVTKLEELCKEMNTNITSLQTIVDVLQSNDFITSIVEIKKDGKVVGYTITFGKHDPITIYHGQNGKDGQNGQDGQNGADGKDGITPVIGVAQDTDGVYYWTLNGEWLLDDNGNKLPVSGKDGQNGTNGSNGQDGTDGKDGQDGEDGKDGADGKDGITPQLKIEEGYWYISYDNGATWTQLGKATGADGQDGKDGADGEDGKDGITPQLKIEDGYWYISYDNGATWTQLGKATGEDGKDGTDGKDGQNGADGKDGQDGDSMFQSVTQDENYVYFTLADGTIIQIVKVTTIEKKVDLVMFIGQSNMAGRGVASESVVVTEGHGYEFRAISDPTQLYPVVEPFGLNENNPTSGVSEKSKTGSLVSAFIEGHYKYRQVPIVGVSCSVGGTSTSFWAPDKKPLNDAIARHNSAKVWLEKNGYTIEHDYMVWLQGENDAVSDVTSDQYATNLIAIIEEMVAEAGVEFCAVIRIGNAKNDPTLADRIILSQTNLCKTYEKAVLVSTMLAGCVGEEMKDTWHFTQATYNKAGIDAGKYAAYYLNNGVQPSMYDPEYDNYFPYGETKNVWSVTTQLGQGLQYEGPSQVIEGDSYNATITCENGYTFETYQVITKGEDITKSVVTVDTTANILTISIAKVTDDIKIIVTSLDKNTNNNNQFGIILDLDFTQKTIEDYIVEGILTLPSTSTTDGLSYTDQGLAGNDKALMNGLKLTNPIHVDTNWEFEISMSIEAYENSESSKTEALYPHLIFLSTTDTHAIHQSNCLAPSLFMTNWDCGARLGEQTGQQITVKSLFLGDGKIHTYKIRMNTTTYEVTYYRDDIEFARRTWNNTSQTLGQYFGYILGAHKGYPSAQNFTLKSGFIIKSMKFTILDEYNIE